ncbi:MAG: baseplate J/gp47 family protein [Oscillospiraceae bacterium]|nr:baseplate J/gp47 family protein [Oscillospiraceae bacterium]
MKTVEEIYNEMLGVFRQETGAEASAVSDLSVKLYAVAAQVYGLYAQAEWLSRQCFPQTAQGEYLDRHAALRGVERKAAVQAKGIIRFSVEAAPGADLTIPVGTVCATAAMTRFETLKEAILPGDGTYVDVPARAVEPGTGGNVPAGSVVMTVPPVGVRSCVNTAPFAGGADAEEDEALRKRVLDTYRRMPNGANAAFYEQGALSFDRVAACTVLPRKRGVGTVDVVVSTTAGLPDEGLLKELQDYFEQRREIAVDVQVKAPTVKNVNVSVRLQVAEDFEGEAIKADVERALTGFFSGERLGKNILVAELNRLVFSREGVANCTILAPAADVAVQEGQLPRLNTLTVEVTA